MRRAQEIPLPEIGSKIVTACKGVSQFVSATPTAVYQGQRLYFCLQSCLEEFEADPENSCLTSHSLPEES